MNISYRIYLIEDEYGKTFNLLRAVSYGPITSSINEIYATLAFYQKDYPKCKFEVREVND